MKVIQEEKVTFLKKFQISKLTKLNIVQLYNFEGTLVTFEFNKKCFIR